ncbi:alcohol dehydrogenase [Thalictrum thalictroides]|uniref:Alcohol dehydrogenase n=1 Tax=Thalictrum thalictroides TaxID=46969 RepID=A0A7J6W6Q7_THATH|nr:alcohol dehydrogenase [Thalictrum thalictroides]
MSKTTSEVITCRAAVCWGLGKPFTIEDIEVEAPKLSEVRIKMLCSSLCHTDILYWQEPLFGLFPRVLGHEGVGVVESIGEGVTDLKEGDLVIPTYLGECGECENCTSGMSNLCFKYHVQVDGLMLDGTSRMSLKGEKLFHMMSCSTWSEYTVVNSNYVLKFDPRLQIEHASLLSCGYSTGFGGAWKEAKIKKGSTVAVFGLGAVGLGAVEGARIMGATKIIGVDLNEWKKEKGEVFGMTDFINPAKSDKPLSDLIKEITGGMGVDYCIECTGAQPLLNQAIESSKIGKGVTILIGTTLQTSNTINPFQMLFGRTLKGSIFGGIKPQSDFPAIIEKNINKELKIDALVTHEIQLDDINRALNEVAKQPDCLKVIIQMSKSV